MTRPQLLVLIPRSQLDRSFRSRLRRFIVLGAGLLVLSLPGRVLASEHEIEGDDDPFDRAGFYVGLGGTYQRNVFESRIEDLIQDALESALPPGGRIGIDLDESVGLNVVAGYRMFPWFAAELQYEWVDEYDIEGSASLPPFGTASGNLYSIEGHSLTANTKWILPFWRIQPYLLLGGGFSVSKVDRGSILDDPNLGPIFASAGIDVDNGTNVDFAARAGVGLDLYLTQNILLNSQASVLLTTLEKPGEDDIDDLNYVSLQAALQYRF